MINTLSEQDIAEFQTFDSTIEDTADYVTRIFKGEEQGLTFGWGPSVDKYTMGLEPENLVIVGGENKAGKTTFAVNTVAANINAGKRVLVVTTEVTAKQYILRLVCRELGISLREIRGGTLTPEQQRAVFKEIYQIGNLHLKVEDLPHCTIEDIEAATERYKPELVVIDHLQRIDPQTDQYALGYKIISQRLKQLAVETEVPVMCLSQVRMGEDWFTLDDSGHFEYQLQKMRTSWTSEPLGEGDKILFLHNLGRYIPAYNGYANVVFHSLRDYESGGFARVEIDYNHQRIGHVETPVQTNSPY